MAKCLMFFFIHHHRSWTSFYFSRGQHIIISILILIYFNFWILLFNLLKIATLVIDQKYLTPKYFDVIGAGIWAGCFYLIAGSFGSAASSSKRNNRTLYYTRMKKNRSLHLIQNLSFYIFYRLLFTMIFAIISIPASIAVTVLSSLDAFFFESECSVINSDDNYYCSTLSKRFV